MEKEADRVISEYLSNVRKRLGHLPDDERYAILDYLKAHFYDALRSRCGGAEPTNEDIYMVMAEMDPPEAFGVEQVKSRVDGAMPSILWLAIVMLGMSVVGKLIVLLAKSDSLMFTIKVAAGVVFNMALLYGILQTRRWAYWIIVVGVPISCVLAFLKGPAVGLATTAVNMAILLPVMMSKDFFLGETE